MATRDPKSYEAIKQISDAYSKFIMDAGMTFLEAADSNIKQAITKNYVAGVALTSGIGIKRNAIITDEEAETTETQIRKITDEDMAISNGTRLKYTRFLTRSLAQSYKSQFHAEGETKYGYDRNTPLKVGSFSGVGYATGELYNSIRVTLKKQWHIGRFEGNVKFESADFKEYNASYGRYIADGRRAGKPPRIADMVSWIIAKKARGTLSASIGSDDKDVLQFAIKILNSKYGGKFPHKQGVTNSRFTGGNFDRPAEIPNWNKWDVNPNIERAFIKIHNRLSPYYVKLMMKDIIHNIDN